jgi:hypothetical protein
VPRDAAPAGDPCRARAHGPTSGRRRLTARPVAGTTKAPRSAIARPSAVSEGALVPTHTPAPGARLIRARRGSRPRDDWPAPGPVGNPAA